MHSSELPVSVCPTNPSSDEAALHVRQVDLTQQHHDLDYLIAALSYSAGCDELLVARLKKRKLHLKDEIARVASDIHTTGDAAAHP